MCKMYAGGVLDTLNTSHTLEISVYQFVTHEKCKMAVKAHTLIYKQADGEWYKYLGTSCTLLLMGAMPQCDLCNAFVPNQIVWVMKSGYYGVL